MNYLMMKLKISFTVVLENVKRLLKIKSTRELKKRALIKWLKGIS